MSSGTIRTIVGLVFIVHAVGHSMGILPAIGIDSTETWHYRSWLFGEGILARVVGVAIWLVGLVGFLGTALGVLGCPGTQGSWRTLAVVSAIISLAGLALYWNAFSTFFNKAGAISVDFATLVGILALGWPSTDLTP